MNDAMFLVIVLGAIFLVVTGVAINVFIEWWKEHKQRLEEWQRVLPMTRR